MRINRLRLKNLNSLKGEFCVDLDADSILGRAGVFAITGPIGAGKTTLLDAVCVALYGQTPRLDTGDAGELMTRHTGDCYAEVEFSVNRKKYRSKWSLRKARGKSEGKIQPTVMELVSLNGSEETIIEEQKNKVVSRITELTGLDFSRFTRSMMLAQGNFAAFLNAKDNERADLLEKMTGTEIYSRISSETYARFREEEQILKNMKLLIENIKLMEPEKYKETLDKLKELEENKKKSQIVLNHLDEQKKWLLEIKELEKTIKNSQHEIEEINVEKNERSSDLKRLELGLKAFPHKGKYDVLENHRKQLVSFEKEKEKLERDIPVLEELVEKQDKNRQNEERLFEAFKLKAEKDEEQISNAIVLDQQIIEDQSDLKKKSEFLVSLQNDLLETRKRMKSVDDSITSTGDKIKQLETFLIEHDIDSPLEQKLPLMNDRVTQLEARRVKLAELSELLTKNKNESALIQKDHEKIIKATKTAEDKVTFIAEQQKAVEELLKNELGGRAPDEWEKDEKHLEKLIVERDKLIQLSNQFFESTDGVKVENEKLKKLSEDLGNIKKQKENLGEALKTGEVLLEQLEKKKELELLISKYEKDRKKLESGEPCPLCGSEEHPWTLGTAFEIGETDKVLKKQKKSLAENREELNKVSTLIAELETIAAHTKMGIAKQAEKQKEITEKWNEIAAEMKIQLGTEAQRTLESEQLKIKTSLDELRKKTAGLKEMGTKLEKLKNELYAAEKQLGQLKLTLQKISDGEKQLVFDRERLQKDLTESGKELETLENTLKNELKGFGEVLPEDGNLNQLVRKLEDRSKRYLASRRELDTYKTKLGPLREQGSKLETQIKSQVEREEEEKKNKESMQRGLAVLISRRKNLLGDKNPEKERTELKKQRRIFDVKLLELNAHLQKNRSDLAAKQQTLSDRKKEQGILLNTIRSAFETLQTDIGKVGFAGEEEFVKALLTSEEQEMLETIKKRLRLRETQTTTRLDDARKKLEVETAKKLTEEDFETIQSVELEKKEQLEKLQLELGAIQEMMRQHDRQKNEKKEQLEKIVGQQQEFDRWDSLNRLIGAADGKKFRRFAQGLTLDYLINLANKNLTKLNDRYYLKRNQLEELGLEVIDMYQADVSRPVSTLSGGETFLVSLALALGLSGLVSKNTSIDSLFLDEGFGTLDTETLETALAALDNLNAEGKTIGIISHVEALKDRISTQLQVKKLSGGVSALEVVQ